MAPADVNGFTSTCLALCNLVDSVYGRRLLLTSPFLTISFGSVLNLTLLLNATQHPMLPPLAFLLRHVNLKLFLNLLPQHQKNLHSKLKGKTG